VASRGPRTRHRRLAVKWPILYEVTGTDRRSSQLSTADHGPPAAHLVRFRTSVAMPLVPCYCGWRGTDAGRAGVIVARQGPDRAKQRDRRAPSKVDIFRCEKARIGYEALDNGFRSCEDSRALQRICDRLGSGAVKRFLWRWLRRLPSPLRTEDLRAGYVYELAFRQFEVSDTRVFDPAPGRARVLRGRDPRPPRCRSTVVGGVDLRSQGHFPHPGQLPHQGHHQRRRPADVRIKQYFKEHRALRTEVVVGDTRDFGIGRRVNAENWHALRAVGEHANKRLCDAQAADAQPAPDVVTFDKVTRPSHIDGQHAPGLPGLAWLDPSLPTEISQRSTLAKAWRQLDHALSDFIDRQLIAA
jgi:hypothetical protein